MANYPAPASSDNASLWTVFSLVWGIGFSIMILRLSISLWQVYKILRDAHPDKDSIKITHSGTQSFSFFKHIVLNHTHYQSGSMKYILAHERAHSNQLHSLDVLFVELLKSLQWFNPFAWLFANEALQNLEFLADHEVLAKHKDVKQYQMALLELAHSAGRTLLRTEFSKSNLKNRIMMMNQPKAPKTQAWKLCLLLPLIGILLMSFSVKIDHLDLKKEIIGSLPGANIPATLSEKDTANDHKEVFTTVENPPRPATGDMASYYAAISKDLKYPVAAAEKNIKGKVFVQFVIQKDGSVRDVKAVKGIGYGCDEEAVRAVKNGPEWIAGTQRGTKVNTQMIIPISFGIPQNYSTQQNRTIKGTVKSEDGQPIIGANVVVLGTSTGTVTNKEGDFRINVKPGQRQLVVTYNGYRSQVVDLSSDDAYEITLEVKSNSTQANDDKTYVTQNDGKTQITVADDKGVSFRVNGKSLTDEHNQPLILLEDKEISMKELKDIEPNMIKSITVSKDSTSTVAKYGEKARHGVIIIELKK